MLKPPSMSLRSIHSTEATEGATMGPAPKYPLPSPDNSLDPLLGISGEFVGCAGGGISPSASRFSTPRLRDGTWPIQMPWCALSELFLSGSFLMAFFLEAWGDRNMDFTGALLGVEPLPGVEPLRVLLAE
ncbi:hypothetical protein Mapa_014798 [Marchantia paleacea]|nr:hypothetical protein Mapa_014798 [Marchantia paleacea]